MNVHVAEHLSRALHDDLLCHHVKRPLLLFDRQFLFQETFQRLGRHLAAEYVWFVGII